MKALLRNIFVICFLFQATFVHSQHEGHQHQTQDMMPKEEAIRLAKETDEIKSLYALDERFEDCVEVEVVEPCDTDWVTCVDGAWVVKFNVGAACEVQHDGRLNIVLLMDGVTGEIKSRYPEAVYFKDALYCQTDQECLGDVELGECQNFVFGQIQSNFKNLDACQCIENKCEIKEEE